MRVRRSHIIIGVLAAAIASGAAAVATKPSSHPQSPPAASQSDQEAVTSNSGNACGVERWAVKTGLDAAAKKVNLTPVLTDISTLRAIPAPPSPSARVSPTEFKTYTIHAIITSYKMEADSDYHLALLDPHAKGTMIAEIPSPSCDLGSTWAKQIAAVRKAFDAKFTVTGQYQNTTTPVTITGVAFFDKIHGQRGVAGNGIEIHPVLSISFK